jgi:hypothetical protein
MIRDRGYTGSIVQLRRAVARLRPTAREPFLKLQAFPAEQAQVDWAHFGQVAVGKARRTLSCFVATLSWSRALYLEFFFDQTMENFLRGHVHAFDDWRGQPRVILYDNLRSAVLERRGNEIHFNPRLMELCADQRRRSMARLIQDKLNCAAVPVVDISSPGPVRSAPVIRKDVSSEPFAMCANPSGPVVRSLHSPNAIGRHYSGATRWRIDETGLETTAEPLPMSSPKNNRVCCPNPRILSQLTWSCRHGRRRLSMSASISTIIRSLPKLSGDN